MANLDMACREFVKHNAVTGSSYTKTPELLANHADMLLRKKIRIVEESDLEGALNKVVCII